MLVCQQIYLDDVGTWWIMFCIAAHLDVIDLIDMQSELILFQPKDMNDLD